MKYRGFLLILTCLFFSLVLDVDHPNLWLVAFFIFIPLLLIFICRQNNAYKILATILVINFQIKQLHRSYIDHAPYYQGFIFSKSFVHNLYKNNKNADPILSFNEITNEYSRNNLPDLIQWDLLSSDFKEHKIKRFFNNINPVELDSYQKLALTMVPESDLSFLFEGFCYRINNNSEVNKEAIKIAITRYFNQENECHKKLKFLIEDKKLGKI